jgi:hypothetical protein
MPKDLAFLQLAKQSLDAKQQRRVSEFLKATFRLRELQSAPRDVAERLFESGLILQT